VWEVPAPSTSAAFPSLPAETRPKEGIRTVIRVVRHLVLLGAFALLLVPASAQASPLTDCVVDDDLDKQYSRSELKEALESLPTDSDEYGLCRDVLTTALHSGSDKGRGRPKTEDSGDGGSISSDERAKREQDGEDLAAITGESGGDPPAPSVDVGGKTVEPGENGLFDLASASNDMPTPLLLALIALGILALAGGVLALRARVPALGRLPILSKIPTLRVPFARPRR
jgi:hypothetical protein